MQKPEKWHQSLRPDHRRRHEGMPQGGTWLPNASSERYLNTQDFLDDDKADKEVVSSDEKKEHDLCQFKGNGLREAGQSLARAFDRTSKAIPGDVRREVHSMSEA